jgi:hypothetical protein
MRVGGLSEVPMLLSGSSSDVMATLDHPIFSLFIAQVSVLTDDLSKYVLGNFELPRVDPMLGEQLILLNSEPRDRALDIYLVGFGEHRLEHVDPLVQKSEFWLDRLRSWTV